MSKMIIAYVPVLHQGYIEFFKKHENVTFLGVLGDEAIDMFRNLRKDIRALSPVLVHNIITLLGFFPKVEILNKQDLINVSKELWSLVMPDEDVCHELYDTLFSHMPVEFDPIFLRWDKTKSVLYKEPNEVYRTSHDEFDKLILVKLDTERGRSSDWWRQIGAAIVDETGIILQAHNHHLPTAHTPYIHGDPRANFSVGVHTNLSSAIHAEATLIAEAAKEGIPLKGTSIYVSTFPCPSCAKLIVSAGIVRCYFGEGYSQLDGIDVLRAFNVEIIRII